MQCLKCMTEMAEYAGTGRPPVYCSKECRRVAEYELRRLDRLLGKLEADALKWREPHTFGEMSQPGRKKKRARFYAAEIEKAEARLRVLLSGGESDL